jgi:23S rRNA (uridine2552-2'-O)-methyltransferase
MAYNRKDHYFHKAKAEDFAARSIYKLEEMDQKLKLFKPGLRILDLGAAPGSWSQYSSKKVGPKGRVLGIDLQAINLTLPNAEFIEADLTSLELEKELAARGWGEPFDMVISDMAPRTTGIKETDQARSLALCELALFTALRFGKPEGSHFICKLFHSDGFESLRNQIRAEYTKVEVVRPKSTRKESKEIFLVGMSRKLKVTPPAV